MDAGGSYGVKWFRSQANITSSRDISIFQPSFLRSTSSLKPSQANVPELVTSETQNTTPIAVDNYSIAIGTTAKVRTAENVQGYQCSVSSPSRARIQTSSQHNVGNNMDSGLYGMNASEDTQKTCLLADDHLSRVSLSQKSSMHVDTQSMRTDTELGAADDACTEVHGINGMISAERNELMEKEGLLFTSPLWCSSLSRAETHSSSHNQPGVMTNVVDDGDGGGVAAGDCGRLTSSHQDSLIPSDTSDTLSQEKKAIKLEIRAYKEVANKRKAGQEDDHGIISVLDRGYHDSRNLGAKAFTRQLICLLQQNIDLQQVFLIHAYIIEHGLEQNTFISNILISMYRRVGFMENATLIFDKMLYPSVVSWNAMMSLLSENKRTNEAFQLYLTMRKQGFDPNQVTLINALSICMELAEGKAIHTYIHDHIDQPCTKLLNALISMYGTCGDVKSARAIFNDMQERDVVSWNSILTAYSENIDGKRSKGKEPIELFWKLPQEGLQPDAVTLVAVLGSCVNAALLPEGMSIHAYVLTHGFEYNVIIGSALTNMYGKCRALNHAFIVFARLPKKTEASWNALITACAEQRQAVKASLLFRQMVDHGFVPNDITFLSMLNACAQPEALVVGKAIHKEISQSKFNALTHINNSLISMYGKCGDIQDARLVFDNMSKRNLVSWSTLMAAYCEKGEGEEALQLFGKMHDADMHPNAVMFLNLLTACCHAELLKEAIFFFTVMVNQYGFRPTLKHYHCMVDLLGRVGKLSETEDMIDQMPCVLETQVWTKLLIACRVHKDVTRAHRIAEYMRHLAPQHVPPYVQAPVPLRRWEPVGNV